MSDSNLPTVKKNELPKLKDLVTDITNYEKSDELNFLLNQPVPEKWIKNHPYIKKTVTDKTTGQTKKVPYPYLPIDKVEYLLRKIFKRYRIEVTGQGQSFNGVYVTVRVHYLNPVYNDWDFHDGIGAIQLQTAKGTSPADLNNINNGALSMAYPLSKTLAIKDACDMFGELFGSNLNRNDVAQYSIDKPKEEVDPVKERINTLFDSCENQDDLDFIKGLDEVGEEYLPMIKAKQIEINKNKK